MKDLNKQIDDVLLFLMNAPTTPAERSKLMMQFSKQVKARHRFKLKAQAPAKPKKSGLVNSPKPKPKRKRFYMNWFEAIKMR
jgi:hypothetical protein